MLDYAGLCWATFSYIGPYLLHSAILDHVRLIWTISRKILAYSALLSNIRPYSATVAIGSHVIRPYCDVVPD